jgi:antitoxin VapB
MARTWVRILSPEIRITLSVYNYTMALNIKDPETERLASEVAALAGESRTEAVRQALRERKQRLLLAQSGRARRDRIVDLLERKVWPQLADGVRGSVLSKDEEEAILGFGPKGV